MAKQTINIGSSEQAGDGESLRSAFDKINDNFDELYLDDTTDFDGDYNSLTNKPTIPTDYGDHSTQGYLTSYTETNDLTAAVTWTNVPDANITQSSVTQHQTALSITESQISDLQSYLTSYTETDPVVGAINGLVKADGAGNISAAVAGTDYLITETLSLTDFKAVVAASTDFADFKTRIAAL
jgi:hypothetical protein